MSKVTVYRYKRYDVMTDENLVRPTRGTRQAIEAAKGIVLEETAEEIDSSLLDPAGFVRD